ncbi:MAG: hypothetical protein JJT96_20735, partial [Opitutales bacterium]|nr:hypothetical protein [Opitutales bacterium]
MDFLPQTALGLLPIQDVLFADGQPVLPLIEPRKHRNRRLKARRSQERAAPRTKEPRALAGDAPIVRANRRFSSPTAPHRQPPRS